jgi:hypothetical protein
LKDVSIGQNIDAHGALRTGNSFAVVTFPVSRFCSLGQRKTAGTNRPDPSLTDCRKTPGEGFIHRFRRFPQRGRSVSFPQNLCSSVKSVDYFNSRLTRRQGLTGRNHIRLDRRLILRL